MTGPTSGFADWQQYASWRGQMFFNQGITLANNELRNLGRYAVGNYASVRVRIAANANGAEVYLWGADDVFDNGLHLIKRWVTRPNTSIHALIPVPTTYIKVEIQGEPTAAWDGTVSVQPVNVATDKVHYYGFNGIAQVFGANLGPGGTAFYYPPVLLPGPAHFWGITDLAGADVIFYIATYTSANVEDIVLESYRQAPAVGMRDNLEIPERPWWVRVLNNTAANRVYYFTVTPRGNLT